MSSAADTSMFVTGEPSEQVAEVCSQPGGTTSVTEYPEAGAGTTTVCEDLRAFVSFPSSSSEKVLGSVPPLVLKWNGVTASGWASLTTVIEPAFGVRFRNVHSTVSPWAIVMEVTGWPFEQLAAVRSYPGTGTWESE